MSAAATGPELGRFARWVYAVKLGSWPKLLVPLLLGQALGVFDAPFSPVAAMFGAIYTVAGLCFIVLLNDWGDREVDVIKRRMFPDGCSPKTIPDGILGARPLLAGALLAGAAALICAGLAAKVLGRPWLVPMALLDLAVFLSYTLPPLRLNYRGGGEWLEMIGVGALLPWWNAYAQSGALISPVYWVLPGFMLLSLASALASGLSDEDSDRSGGKVTYVTLYGNPRVRAAVEVLVVAGSLALSGGALVVLPPWLAILPGLLGLSHVPRLRGRSAAAVTNAFAAQAAYKGQLHRAIWYSATLLALCLIGMRATEPSASAGAKGEPQHGAGVDLVQRSDR